MKPTAKQIREAKAAVERASAACEEAESAADEAQRVLDARRREAGACDAHRAQAWLKEITPDGLALLKERGL